MAEACLLRERRDKDVLQIKIPAVLVVGDVIEWIPKRGSTSGLIKFYRGVGGEEISQQPITDEVVHFGDFFSLAQRIATHHGLAVDLRENFQVERTTPIRGLFVSPGQGRF